MQTKLKTASLCLALLLAFTTKAQVNLVPNPSFETYTACPYQHGQIEYSGNWYTPTAGTSDYYHSCFTFDNHWGSNCDVPLNYLGFQNALEIGEAYAGIIAFQDFNYHEYLQTKLTGTLELNQKYYATLYVSLADSARFATDDLGIYFSQNPISRPDWGAFSYSPQIENPEGQFLTDKIYWMKISGSFIAEGNEQYITIGSFKNNFSIDTLRVMPNSANSDYRSVYYYVDQVCLSTDSSFCNIPVGLRNKSLINHSILYKPDEKKIGIILSGSYLLEILDFTGAKKFEGKMEGSQTIDVSSFNNGCYIIILNEHQNITKKKIIIH
jgi:hypothetical protein